MVDNIWMAWAITFFAALVWLRINDYLAHRGWISSSLSRKIIHIGTGPIFVLCWLLFPEHPASRFMAATIPLAFSLQFFLVGMGVLKDPASVKAMSRTGDRSEILRGPLYYGIIFVLLTLVYWKNNLIGITALMLLCGGDGFADIIGKRFNAGIFLKWSPQKSLIGSLAMFLGGWIFSLAVVGIYNAAGQGVGNLSSYILPVTMIALVGTLVESLPFHDIDNITVTASAVILGHLWGI